MADWWLVPDFAGSDGTRVWDLATQQQVRVPAWSDIRGASTVLLWIKREDDVREALITGTQGGYLLCWRQEDLGGKTIAFNEISCRRLSQPAEISGLDFDPESNRLAVCHRGGVVQIFTLNAEFAMEVVFSDTIPSCVPRAHQWKCQ
ncbi:hypothetical protein B0H15DRAFT_948211 [Mycena belliarum]|uniref:Uncharacterized protein n=1 Tax=Mycena belliarum TaxID=1033014 RepID=A0AAD6U6L6_9AGAR|nr:hypothetical protein B0H15DRAFT_948211 [Mycena belliae]